jgi:hypothetical protein
MGINYIPQYNSIYSGYTPYAPAQPTPQQYYVSQQINTPAYYPSTSYYPTPYIPPYYPPTAFINSEGNGPSGLVMDAAQNKFAVGNVQNQWQNYTVGSLTDSSKSSVKSDLGKVLYYNAGSSPTLQGGVAGDPKLYILSGTSQSDGSFHPPAGTIVRVFEDNGIVINNKYDDINPSDGRPNIAATDSTAVITDPKTGEKHTITLSDGQTKYTNPQGQVRILDPNSTAPLIIGDPNDPLAKLEIKGSNPGNVPITLTHYERLDPETLKELQQRGIDPSFASKLRSENEIRWGNRVADGNGATERASAGTTNPTYLNQYYDVHIVNKGNTWAKTPQNYGGGGYGGGSYGGYNPYPPVQDPYTPYQPYNPPYNNNPQDPYAPVQPNYPPSYNPYMPVQDPYQGYNPYQPMYNPYQGYTPYQPTYYDPFQAYNNVYQSINNYGGGAYYPQSYGGYNPNPDPSIPLGQYW